MTSPAPIALPTGLLLGGQLHNSTSSSPAHIGAAFDKVAAMDATTVIASVSWDLVEQVEGRRDFTLVDVLLREANRVDLRLVLLWFGAFKNAASTYAPTWVRQDTTRFPRAVVHGGYRTAFAYEGQTAKPVLSVFSDELRRADTAAFVALCAHLAQHDDEGRVALVQIENEVGLLADSRDRSDAAEQAWARPVPTRLAGSTAVAADLRHTRDSDESRSWDEVFGENADEAFMAWHFAQYVDHLAAAGKAVLPVPMYVNAWLGPQPGQARAGQYPSGGPTERVLDVWKVGAPSVDLLCPDIYVEDSASVQAAYARADNRLFVPETRFRVAELFRALGCHDALGWSVFGIEDGRVGSLVASAFGHLRFAQELVSSAQRDGRIEGVVLEPGQTEQRFSLGGIEITARATRELFERMLLDAGVVAPAPTAGESAGGPPSETDAPGAMPAPPDTRPCGIVVAEPDDTFVLIGQGLTLDFASGDGRVEIDWVQEGRFGPDGWVSGRALNGDERLHILPSDRIGAARVRLLRPA